MIARRFPNTAALLRELENERLDREAMRIATLVDPARFPNTAIILLRLATGGVL